MLVEDFIRELTRQEGCARVASEILRRTAHLIKARSVAVGAARCIFKARLVEAFGASGFLQSVIPGKGSLVHQILAIAFPKAIKTSNSESRSPSDYVEEAFGALKGRGIVSDPSPSLILSAKSDAEKMLATALEEVPKIARKIGLDVDRARVYTEMRLMSYKLHIWGVLDALLEDAVSRRAIVIDWKTAEEDEAADISDPDIAQVCIYGMLVADRLGFEDPRFPVLKGQIVPVIIRPRGRDLVSSISPVHETCSRKMSLEDYLNNSILAAEHLTLIVSDVRKHAGETYDRICRYDAGEVRASAFRRTPPGLPRGNPNNDRFPCKVCFLREECKFYIASFEKPEEIDKLAWRARLSTYVIRENAMMPYKNIHNLMSHGFGVSIFEGGELFRFEDGNRVDVFESAHVDEDLLILERELRKRELEEDRIISVREGRPVAVFFNESEVKDPLLRLSLVGRVDEVRDEGERVVAVVGMPNIPSKLQPILFEFYLRWYDLADKVLAVETNVDLTQMELRAIDAYHRGTKQKIKAVEEEKLERAKNEALEVLFGKLPSW